MSKNSSNKLNPYEWVDRHGEYLFNYAIGRTYSTETAEDLVQETFLSAWSARESYKGGSSERTWLISILKRKIIDHYRKRSKEKQEPLRDHAWPFSSAIDDEGEWMGDRRPKNWQDHSMEMDFSGEFMEILRFCLSLLPDKWSATFTLKEMEEFSTEDVCKQLGISSSNLWVMLHRARLQLRECIEDKWFKDPV